MILTCVSLVICDTENFSHEPDGCLHILVGSFTCFSVRLYLFVFCYGVVQVPSMFWIVGLPQSYNLQILPPVSLAVSSVC